MGININPTHVLDIDGPQDILNVRLDGETKLSMQNNGGLSVGADNVNGTPKDGLFIAGDTGFGRSNPDERVDVNGSMKISGLIKPNGSSGSKGQLLKNNGNGSMSWSDPSRFPNNKDFFNPDLNNPSTWVVPSGVTEVLFEVWGPGGSGHDGGGGGGGGYVKSIIQVSAGQSFTITVGKDGTGASRVLAPNGGQIICNQGGDATSLRPGFGGSVSVFTSWQNQRQLGGNGQSNEITYGQSGATTFVKSVDCGSGGHAACTNHTSGSGGMRVLNQSNNSVIEEVFSTPGSFPGGGGGGGFSSTNNRAQGGDGYIIVRW